MQLYLTHGCHLFSLLVIDIRLMIFLYKIVQSSAIYIFSLAHKHTLPISLDLIVFYFCFIVLFVLNTDPMGYKPKLTSTVIK